MKANECIIITQDDGSEIIIPLPIGFEAFPFMDRLSMMMPAGTTLGVITEDGVECRGIIENH
jgi:hypothetical protein